MPHPRGGPPKGQNAATPAPAAKQCLRGNGLVRSLGVQRAFTLGAHARIPLTTLTPPFMRLLRYCTALALLLGLGVAPALAQSATAPVDFDMDAATLGPADAFPLSGNDRGGEMVDTLVYGENVTFFTTLFNNTDEIGREYPFMRYSNTVLPDAFLREVNWFIVNNAGGDPVPIEGEGEIEVAVWRVQEVVFGSGTIAYLPDSTMKLGTIQTSVSEINDDYVADTLDNPDILPAATFDFASDNAEGDSLPKVPYDTQIIDFISTDFVVSLIIREETQSTDPRAQIRFLIDAGCEDPENFCNFDPEYFPQRFYTYRDSVAGPGGAGYYRFLDYNNLTTEAILTDTDITDISNEGISVAQAFRLEPTYPNPTAIGAYVDYKMDQAQDVEIALFDVLGRKIQTLVDGPVSAGRHSTYLSAADFPAGVYFVRMVSEGQTATRQLTITH